MDMQIGDRVTYKDDENTITCRLIKSNFELGYLESNINEEKIEILKIERPQYEEIYKEGVRTHHVTIETDKLKELILENHSNYMNVSLKTKEKIVSKYAEFDNDTELLEFLKFMEE